MPTDVNNFTSAGHWSCSKIIALIIPSRNDPLILTIKIPSIPGPKINENNLSIEYLATEPIAPPNAIDVRIEIDMIIL